MFYYVLFFTLSLLISSSTGKPFTSPTSEPKRCCYTKQYSADLSMSVNVRSSNGSTKHIYGTYNVAYDVDRGLIGTKGGLVSSENGRVQWSWVIQSIKEKKIYTINETAKTCSVSPMPVLPMECIPETASYQHSNISKYEGKEIMTDTWVVNILEASIYITVTRDGLCVPMSTSVFSPQIGMISSQTLTHFELTIKDQSIIEVPKECLGVNQSLYTSFESIYLNFI